VTREEIGEQMTDWGFVPVPDDETLLGWVMSGTAFYHPVKKVFVVDARPENVLVDQAGNLHVIDVMVVKEDELLARIAEKITR
jgi:hypothetical protein